MESVLSVRGLSKEYQLGSEVLHGRSFREMIVGMVAAPIRRFRRLSGQDSEMTTFLAIDDISFELAQGEVIGVIGKNGAGKSTLLKLLSRITTPTKGEIKYKGRLASLLEVGTGFHPELTGRENIFLNGSILGMKRSEIHDRFDEIVKFAGVERFLDTPVKRYSSGMYVRLAFSVAAHLDPDILVVDEVLAVGDQQFQKKCLGKMRDVASGGQTVVFVSHNMSMIEKLCSRCLVIEGGKIVMDDKPSAAIERYLTTVTEEHQSVYQSDSDDQKNEYLIRASAVNRLGEVKPVSAFNEEVLIEIEFKAPSEEVEFVAAIRLVNFMGVDIFSSWNKDFLNDKKYVAGKIYRERCVIPASLLRPGQYTVVPMLEVMKLGARIKLEQGHLSFEISQVGWPFELTRSGVTAPRLEWQVV